MTQSLANKDYIELETDYLIVGVGAMGMAFADVLVENSNYDMIMVDRHAKPGGHWNVAYPFVTLHQPSNFYGVSSRELSKGHINQAGLNKGLYELASGAEVSAYFDDIMREQFIPTERVHYYPMCEYTGDFEQIGKGTYTFESTASGKCYRVNVRKKIVNATYLTATVPATHTPNYSIDESISFMPLNDLVRINEAPEGYTVVGGGKTGIDACLWLLEQGVEPNDIRWIMPRDAWLLDRKNAQPTLEFFENTFGNQANLLEAIVESKSIPDLFSGLEDCGALLRIDTSVTPSMFHGATISQLELTELRRIKNIIRMGRVTSIESDRIMLENGEIPTGPGQIHVDCSARLIKDLSLMPVFNGDVITPQTTRPYQPVFSAAMVAYVEISYDDEEEKNRLCTVVPLPNHDTDWIRMQFAMMLNQYNWSLDKALFDWITNCRLDAFTGIIKSVPESDEAKQAILKRINAAAVPAVTRLQELIDQIEPLSTELVARYA